MKRKSQMSRRGLLWPGFWVLVCAGAALMQWLNVNTHNDYRLAGIVLECFAGVMAGATGLVNRYLVNRGRARAE